jgi:hypothetical protein
MFKPVLDFSAVEYEDALDVPPTTRLPELRRRLRSRYRERPDVDRVMVRVGGHDIGVATRAGAEKDLGHLGTESSASVGPGSGDGATLPGLPGEFRAVHYKCGDQDCDRTALRSFFDERDIPECAAHPAIRMVYDR